MPSFKFMASFFLPVKVGVDVFTLIQGLHLTSLVVEPPGPCAPNMTYYEADSFTIRHSSEYENWTQCVFRQIEDIRTNILNHSEGKIKSIYKYIYMHSITVDEKRGHKFEGGMGGVFRRA